MIGKRLSICIATYNRARFIGETLDSILCQLEPGVEIVVVDGASTDDTRDVMGRYCANNASLRYFRETANSGVDADYDRAVGYADGEYCWLMTDDDLLALGSVQRVLRALDSGCNLLIVNTELRSYDLSRLLEKRRLNISGDMGYEGGPDDAFFPDVANHLAFIAAVIIKRSIWTSRDRVSYFGTLFVHVGVIFQHPPVRNVLVICDPLVIVRHSNSMWVPRSFEIWMFKWPELIWSFVDFSDASKAKVCRREPWRSSAALLYARAMGSYSTTEYRRYLNARMKGIRSILARVAAAFPVGLANFVMVFYHLAKKKTGGVALEDLLANRSASTSSKLLARAFGL